MPILLIRSNKDNVVHGTDNERTTGCRMRLQGMGYSREGEMSDIVDLTCDRCKEVFATKLIRESNREESRIAKEEKKRFLRAKKQGIVTESTYEEYVYNRESEASSKRATYEANNSAGNLPPLKADMQNGAGYQQYAPQQSQPVQQNYQSQQVQPVYQSYQPQQFQQAPDVQPSYASQQFTQAPDVQPSYASQQFAQTQDVQPSYAPQQSVAPENPQSMFSWPKEEISPDIKLSYAPSYENYIKEQENKNVSQVNQPEAAPVYEQYQPETRRNDATQQTNVQSTYQSPAMKKPQEDDFLAQFMVKQDEPSQQVQPQQNKTTPGEILSAANDILAQFNADVTEAENQQAQGTNSFMGDASSFYSNQVPLVDAFSSSKSISEINNEGVSNEFGSLNIPENRVVTPPSDNSYMSGTPSYQPQNNMTGGLNSGMFDELTMNDIQSEIQPTVETFDSVVSPSGYESVSTLSPTDNGFETISPVKNEVPPVQNYTGSYNANTSYGSVTPPPVNVQSDYQSMNTQFYNQYSQPSNNQYAQPVNNQFTQNQFTQPVNNQFVQPTQNVASQFVQPVFNQNQNVNPAPAFGTQQKVTIDSIEEALRQLGAEGIKTQEEIAKEEKEEIVPDFIAYVPSSSKVLYNKPPVNDLSSGTPKRMLTAREAKKLAKIDAKFYKDLKERGFSPAELKSQRRGK